MGRAAIRSAVAVGILVAGCVGAVGQAPDPGSTQPAPSTPPGAPAVSADTPQTAAGGKLHGHVKSGTTPLPGVTVTAQNTLTGKRFSTTTDTTGAWSMTIPSNGRYVVRTQFAAFAQGSQEALLNAAGRDQTVNFELTLASRAVAQEQQHEGQAAQAMRQLAGAGAQSL